MGLSNCVNIPLPISHSISTHSHAAKSKSSTTLSVLNNSQNLVISWIPEKPLLALKRWRPNSAHTWTPVACIAQIFKLVVREQQISENLPSLSWANPKMITSQFQNYLLKWVQHELLGPKSLAELGLEWKINENGGPNFHEQSSDVFSSMLRMETSTDLPGVWSTHGLFDKSPASSKAKLTWRQSK